MIRTNNGKGYQFSMRDFYYVLFRQKLKLLLFFGTVMVATVLYTFLAPRIYQSDAKLLVRLGRESVTLDPTATTGQVVAVAQLRESEIKSEFDLLGSQDLAEKVVDQIGYKAFLATGRAPDEVIKGNSSKIAAGSLHPGGWSSEEAKDRDNAVKIFIQISKKTAISFPSLIKPGALEWLKWFCKRRSNYTWKNIYQRAEPQVLRSFLSNRPSSCTPNCPKPKRILKT
jgi:hypothetical protein